MNSFILDAQASNSSFDARQWGGIESLIPADESLRDRIILNRSVLHAVDTASLGKFFASYNEKRVAERATRIAGEYLFEQFLASCVKRGIIDEVSYIEEEPGTEIKTRNYRYCFTDGGRTIDVYPASSTAPLTELARLVTLRKGHEEQTIMCNIQMTHNYHLDRKLGDRIRASKELLGKNASLFPTCIYTKDVFALRLQPQEQRPVPLAFSSDAIAFLDYNAQNLLLIYSATSKEMKTLGQVGLEQLRKSA